MHRKKVKINKKMLISEIIDKYPELVESMVGKFGLHCVGCPMAGMESLEEGGMGHGMSDEEIDNMVKKLNSDIK